MLFAFRVDNLFIFRVGYNNVDGLDPSQGYLNGAMAKGIFRKVYKAFIDPDTPTCIQDCSYDATEEDDDEYTYTYEEVTDSDTEDVDES